MAYQDIFESLGLSPNEAKIYESLVEHGESSISYIAVAAKVHRRNAYDAIERLIDKGLTSELARRQFSLPQYELRPGFQAFFEVNFKRAYTEIKGAK